MEKNFNGGNGEISPPHPSRRDLFRRFFGRIAGRLQDGAAGRELDAPVPASWDQLVEDVVETRQLLRRVEQSLGRPNEALSPVNVKASAWERLQAATRLLLVSDENHRTVSRLSIEFDDESNNIIILIHFDDSEQPTDIVRVSQDTLDNMGSYERIGFERVIAGLKHQALSQIPISTRIPPI